jgi:hypothetical protein
MSGRGVPRGEPACATPDAGSSDDAPGAPGAPHAPVTLRPRWLWILFTLAAVGIPLAGAVLEGRC